MVEELWTLFVDDIVFEVRRPPLLTNSKKSSELNAIEVFTPKEKASARRGSTVRYGLVSKKALLLKVLC